MVTVITQGNVEARNEYGKLGVAIQDQAISVSTLESSPPSSFFFRSSFYSPQSSVRKSTSCSLTEELLEAHARDALNAGESLSGFISIPLPPTTAPEDIVVETDPGSESRIDLLKEHPTFTLDITPDSAVKLVRFTTRPSARVVLGFVLRAKHANYPSSIFTGSECSDNRLYTPL